MRWERLRSFAGSIAFIAVSLAAPAVAQAEVEGFGPYRFGMTQAEARAASPGAWRVEASAPITRPQHATPTGRVSAPAVTLAGRRFEVRMGFRKDRLRAIELTAMYTAPRPAECEADFPRLLAELEQRYGPATGEQTLWEAANQTSTAHVTAGGSAYRRYVTPSGPRFVAGTTAPYRLEARGMSLLGRACVLTVNLRNDYGEGADVSGLPPQPTEAELATAPASELNKIVGTLTGEDMLAMSPPFWRDREITAVAELACIVQADRTLNCAIAKETPPGFGFGDSARMIMTRFLAAPEAAGGAPAGARITRNVTFN